MHISDAFHSGNITVIDASDPSDVRLEIRNDAGDEHLQWFHFRVSGARGVPLTLRIVNAGKTSYPEGWEDYRAAASHDRQARHRVDTTYTDGVLTISLTPETDAVELAYFAPFSHEQHLDLIARCARSPRCRHEVLGRTLDGADMDLLVVGEPAPHKKVLWVIARQHPGETMAEWWMEGFLARVLDPADPLARRLLERSVLYVVPNMNPDGSRRGHLRVNACGANLNREWHAPTLERSPEVKLVRDRMDETGVDFCLDVHGDEALPYNFISGAEGVPSWTARLAALQQRFEVHYERANPDFQRVHGYPVDEPGKANMTMCTSQVAERYSCLAMTLEQPFKDNADAPDLAWGWSPERCRKLGASVLHPILEVLAEL